MTEENRWELERLCEMIRQAVPAQEIYLFGPYAYGIPHKGSDYGLYVVIPDDGPRPLTVMQDLNVALHKPKRSGSKVDGCEAWTYMIIYRSRLPIRATTVYLLCSHKTSQPHKCDAKSFSVP